MGIEDNLRDLRRHLEDFLERRGFTYAVLDHKGEVIGCAYIYPSIHPGTDAGARSWVRVDGSHLDRTLYEAVWAWLRTAWPFEDIDHASRSPRSGR
jgi:hypothetical protein